MKNARDKTDDGGRERKSGQKKKNSRNVRYAEMNPEDYMLLGLAHDVTNDAWKIA